MKVSSSFVLYSAIGCSTTSFSSSSSLLLVAEANSGNHHQKDLPGHQPKKPKLTEEERVERDLHKESLKAQDGKPHGDPSHRSWDEHNGVFNTMKKDTRPAPPIVKQRNWKEKVQGGRKYKGAATVRRPPLEQQHGGAEDEEEEEEESMVAEELTPDDATDGDDVATKYSSQATVMIGTGNGIGTDAAVHLHHQLRRGPRVPSIGGGTGALAAVGMTSVFGYLMLALMSLAPVAVLVFTFFEDKKARRRYHGVMTTKQQQNQKKNHHPQNTNNNSQSGLRSNNGGSNNGDDDGDNDYFVRGPTTNTSSAFPQLAF